MKINNYVQRKYTAYLQCVEILSALMEPQQFLWQFCQHTKSTERHTKCFEIAKHLAIHAAHSSHSHANTHSHSQTGNQWKQIKRKQK